MSYAGNDITLLAMFVCSTGKPLQGA